MNMQQPIAKLAASWRGCSRQLVAVGARTHGGCDAELHSQLKARGLDGLMGHQSVALPGDGFRCWTPGVQYRLYSDGDAEARLLIAIGQYGPWHSAGEDELPSSSWADQMDERAEIVLCAWELARQRRKDAAADNRIAGAGS